MSVHGEAAMTQRLREIGFTPTAEVECLFRSAMGDPTAYRICGTVIALRREDSRKILVFPC